MCLVILLVAALNPQRKKNVCIIWFGSNFPVVLNYPQGLFK